MSEDKKKYPWIKSIFGKKNSSPAEGVYAGPAQMNGGIPVPNGKADKKRGSNVGPEVECVYAGPEYFEQQTQAAEREDDPIIEEVYAGPEFFERLYDEPDEDSEEEKTKEITDEKTDDGSDDASMIEDKQIMQALYAGPAMMPPKFEFNPDDPRNDPRMFMTVYGGPDYFNPDPNKKPIGVQAPTQNETPFFTPSKRDVALIKCVCCGKEIDADSKFCKECGAKVEKKEKTEGRCPMCGNRIDSEMKFCVECGTPVKFGE